MSYPLVFIHGWGQHGGAWQALLESLSTHHTIHNLELPGHGAAAWQAPGFDLDALVDTYAAQAPEQCTVIGWSLGGILAVRWAQRYPAQVQKLVLMATTPCFGERSDWSYGTPDAVQQAFAAAIAANPTQGLARFADLLAEGEADVRSVRRQLRALLAAAPTPDPEALSAGLHFLAETDLRTPLREAPPQQATLLLHGEGDTITPFAAAEWLAATLPHVRLHGLPHCGHAPMLSHTAEVLAALQMFLDD